MVDMLNGVVLSVIPVQLGEMKILWDEVPQDLFGEWGLSGSGETVAFLPVGFFQLVHPELERAYCCRPWGQQRR